MNNVTRQSTSLLRSTNRYKKCCVKAIICTALLATSSAVKAVCTFAPGYSIDTQISTTFGNVVVPAAAAVGSVVASVTKNDMAIRGNFITNCVSANENQRMHDWRNPGLPSVVFGGQTLYQSGVPGFAIRIVTPGQGYTSGLFGTGGFDRILDQRYCRTTGRYCGDSFGPVTFELVKISTTTGSGAMSSGILVRTSIRGWNVLSTFNLMSSSIVKPTCAVTRSAISVSLPEVHKSAFHGVGTSVEGKDFAIPLTCAASTDVRVTLDGTPDGSGRAGVFALNTEPNAARGVGVEVLFNNTPVTIGNPLPVGTTTADGPFNINLVARYIQTQGSITGGAANASATFTMTYN